MKIKSTLFILFFAISFSFSQVEKNNFDNNIRSIFQDSKGNYWFGTNAAGVYRYDGKILTQYTYKDGLSDNQIQSIQEDELGNIWFGTGVFGVSKFDGNTFTTFISNESSQVSNSIDIKSKTEPNNLWFYAGGGAFFYNNSKLNYLPIGITESDIKISQNSPKNLSRFSVYTILKDTKGNLWFGTQAEGVCCYDGKSFTWFTEKGLAGPAVLCLFEDKKGNIWMGNNGAGLFCYDGKKLINFTEEKKLSNDEFRISGESKPGTLARIYSINEDNNGTLWIGTVDTGVWTFDGKNIMNYTTKDGLSSNAVNTIYKDKFGEIWFGTDENGICKFNGKTFTKFKID
ncbi:MAG: two-component regulator propeller domain-containing protein [Bacteroidota bacterium]